MSDDFSERAALGFHHRSFDIADFEMRAADTGDSVTFEGIACTVDHPYMVRDNLGEYSETIASGAFKRTLADPQARIELRFNHDHKREPYAVFDPATGAHSLTLSADPNLRVKATLDRSRPDVQILRSMIEHREVTQMSIGFNDVKGAVRWNSAYTERSVDDLRLMETSILGRGANDLTAVSVRSLVQGIAALDGEVDEAELRRSIAYLERLLPETTTVTAAAEAVERTGLEVNDEFIELQRMRFLHR